MNAQMTNTAGIAALSAQGNQMQGNPAQANQGQAQPQQQPPQPQNQPNGNPRAVLSPELQHALEVQEALKVASQRNAAMQSQVPGGTIMEQQQMQLQQLEQQKAQQEAMQQQAMQQQMMQRMAMMQQPQQQPIRAAHGGLLQLPSHLGQHYAGGGIVAFNGDEDEGSYVMTDPNGYQYTGSGVTDSRSKKDTPYLESVANALGFPVEVLKRIIQAPNQRDYIGESREKIDRPRLNDPGVLAKQLEEKLSTVRPELNNPAELRKQLEAKLAGNSAASQRRTQESTGIPALAAPKTQAEPANLHGDMLWKYAEKQLGRDPAAEGDAAYTKHRERLGIDAMAKEAADDAAARNAMFNKQQEGGGLRNLFASMLEGAKADPRLGLTGIATGMGTAFNKGVAASDAAAMANNAEQMKLRAEIRKNRMEGNQKAADAGEKRLEEAQRAQSAAGQIGASAYSTEESAKTRLQEAQLRVREMHQRASEAAAQRNDQKLQQLLATSYAAAESAANSETAAMAKQAAAMAKDFDPALYKQEALARSLAGNPVYQKVLRDLNIPVPTAKVTTNDGWSAKIKGK